MVLWFYRTSYKATTGETPFSLTYEVDVIIPVKIGIPTFKVENFKEEYNNVLLSLVPGYQTSQGMTRLSTNPCSSSPISYNLTL